MRRAILMFALAASACAGPRPAVPKAAAVLPPPGWRDGGAADAAVDAQWWQGFGDPVLARLVECALAGNVDIEMAAARVDEARARFSLAGAEQLPDLSLAAGGERDRHVDAFGQAVEETAGQGQVAISYDLDLFGRLRNAMAAAKATLLASEAARDNVRLAVAASVASGYIQLRALDARLSVLQATLASRDASLKVAQRRADAGYSTALELRQAQAQRDDAAQLIPATQLAIRRQEDGLSVLLGDNPGPIPRGAPLDALTLPPPAAVMPAALLRRRPDIAAAEQQLVSADRSLDSARAAFLPSIQLNGTAGYVASSLLMSNPVSVFALGGSILAPLFDAGRLRAEQRAQAAERDVAAFAYRQAALNAFREVENALDAVARTDEQEAALIREQQAASSLLTLASNRYREGYSPYLEQVDAERGLLATDLAVVQIRADRLASAVTLYQAVGGGWDGSALAAAGADSKSPAASQPIAP